MFTSTKRARVDAGFGRSTPPALNTKTDKLIFQCMASEELLGETPPGFPTVQSNFKWSYTKVPNARSIKTQGPITNASVVLYGCTNDGHSVMVNVHGMYPYFYATAPAGFGPQHCTLMLKQLTELVHKYDTDKPILRVELVHRKNIYGYTPQAASPFLRVTMAYPRSIASARKIFQDGFECRFFDGDDPSMGKIATRVQCCTFESNVEYVLRMMIDKGIAGSGWVECPAGTYQPRPLSWHKTECQYEVDMCYGDLVAHSIDEMSHVAPLRILSFDIECAGRPGVFPEAEKDPVIQIGCYVMRQGEKEPFIAVIFTLNTCSPIAGAHVFAFAKEEELLVAWKNFVIRTDPDILTGYNIVNFDIPYLLNRAEHLKVKEFPFLGRMKGVKTEMKDSTFSSKAYGTKNSKLINIEGRIQFDMLQVCQREYKLRSYTLNSVATHFLGDTKEDVHYSAITPLFNGTADTRRRLAVYCLKDSLLPLRLMNKLMNIINYMEQSRVCGVPFTYLITRGQQIKVFSQLLRKARAKNMITPFMKSEASEDGVAYEGATVLDPITGLHVLPIATLDFASLYPSIMQAHNLCYSSWIKPGTVCDLPEGEITLTPTGDRFVKATSFKGILPEILEDLLGARKRAKADMKKEKDPFKYAVFDGRQLALKVSANSCYGFTYVFLAF